jgi:uncharacterized protein Usg
MDHLINFYPEKLNDAYHTVVDVSKKMIQQENISKNLDDLATEFYVN